MHEAKALTIICLSILLYNSIYNQLHETNYTKRKDNGFLASIARAPAFALGPLGSFASLLTASIIFSQPKRFHSLRKRVEDLIADL